MHWRLYQQEAGLQKELARTLTVSPITAQVLINRGVKNVEEAKRFLYPTLTHLHDPFLMADMERAVDRVMRAINGGEKIVIFGDYDTDGATSTALLIRFFGSIGIDTHYYIPHRVNEGYGMHESAIDSVKKLGAELIITVDNGIGAVKEVEYAKSLGIDTIVTDHHEPHGELPKACAVIDPKRPDCSFPFKGLAGVGVAFNLIMALRQRLREAGFFSRMEEPRLKELLDIVALGTVADVVPLVDENRLFVKFGIEELKKSTKKGIGALKLVSGIERADQVSSMTVAFRLAPRINAAGRIDDQHMGVRLLTTDDAEEALELAEKLDRLNSKRQAIEAAILKEADLALKSDPSFDKEKAIVLYNEKWHIGVLGIVAARLAEAHLKPSVVIGASGGIARGSARSVGNYDIIAALSQACEHLLSFGGHAHAAGLSIDPDKIGAFRARICEIVASTLADDDRAEKIDVDCQIEPSDVTEELVKELEFLEPFGEGNKEPVFSLKEMRVSDARIVAEKHLKLKFTDKLIVLEGIGFGMGGRIVTASDILDVAFIPQRDTWKGNGAVQLKLRDICSK